MLIPAKFRRITRNPVITAKTPRATSKFTLNNPRRLEVEELRPEEFFPAGAVNCDYVFVVPEAPVEIYIELKGGDLNHAVEQLKATLTRLKSPLIPKLCFVIIRRSPASSAETQKLRLAFQRATKHILEVRGPEWTHTI
jgi:hypothetical protein